ncbi:hypothetical protein EDB19DRAFT_1753021 [Suillus lakei]|nr:hypothetical protein EDB19DRAFT_1753021 [Suillus lakei]
MENMTNTIITHSDSAASMSITDALAFSPTSRLTPAERKAFGRSDHKAGKVLGITLTRNHVAHRGRRLALCPSPDQENAQGENSLGEMMAIGAKRPCNHKASAVTVIGPLKDLVRVIASGMGMIEKRNKKPVVAGDTTQRVVLGLLRSNESLGKEGKEELSTSISDDSACSFLEPDENEDAEEPPGASFLGRNDEEGEDDLFGGSPRDLVWDVENPLATPPSPALQRRIEAIRLGETIEPLDVSPGASLCYTTDFQVSAEEESPALSSDDSFDDVLRPAERAYLDFLIAQDEPDGQPMERRRAKLRSRNKMLDVLGTEARQALDGQR